MLTVHRRGHPCCAASDHCAYYCYCYYDHCNAFCLLLISLVPFRTIGTTQMHMCCTEGMNMKGTGAPHVFVPYVALATGAAVVNRHASTLGALTAQDAATRSREQANRVRRSTPTDPKVS